MVERREEVKRPGLRSEGIKGSHWRKEKRSIRSFFGGEELEKTGVEGEERERKQEVRAEWREKEGMRRATDQEPSSPGTEQVQAASKAFGPEGAARA